MNQSGEHCIAAERGEVWRALNDPQTLKRCITGCQSMHKRPDGGFAAVVKARVGPVSATFKAALDLTDVNPPESYTINIVVQGGVAGFAKGSAQVALADDDGATVLRYTATANVGGKLAQVGSRLVDAAARKLAQDFFKAFQVEMSVSAPDLAVRRGQGATGPDGTAAADESRARPGAQWKPWAAIAIVSIIGVVSASGGLW